jgi:hypothetical protein
MAATDAIQAIWITRSPKIEQFARLAPGNVKGGPLGQPS